MARIFRAPEGTEFEEDTGRGWLCMNCKRVATDPEFCDYCEFPRYNQAENEDPVDHSIPEPGTIGGRGAVTRDTPPTDPPEGVDPGSHGGML
jgi:hypothetical protein